MPPNPLPASAATGPSAALPASSRQSIAEDTTTTGTKRVTLWCPAFVLLACFAFDACTLLPLNLYGSGNTFGEALGSYNDAVADLWIWLIVRVVVAIGTVVVSLIVFSAPKGNDPQADRDASEHGTVGMFSATSISLNTQRSIVEEQPLINDTASDIPITSTKAPLPLYKNEPLLKIRDRSRTLQGRVMLGLLCVMFFLHIGCNVYTAIKAMRFKVYNDHEYGLGIHLDKLGLAAAMLCLHVLSCSVELFVTSHLLSRAAKRNSYVHMPDGTYEEDHDVNCPLLHPHPLKYISRTVMSSCNVCSMRFRVRDRKFTCEICDFNTCSRCLETKIDQMNTAGTVNMDGALTAASDKTVVSIGRWAYARRIAVIANQFRRVLIIGLACLVVSQVVNIILPKYQGNVIDAVVNRDSDTVRRDIEWYVGLGLGQLLFSSIRTYCTIMTSQYATNTVRIMLFSALTHRSVAFFDATSTGALQSRLSSDSTQMVSPLSTLFNDTISNVLVLIGTTFMAFFVSWKLALLAFTVLGPIVYLTSTYAQVSRRLVRQIRDSVAEGGAISNQVLTSIRTVKGFANENFEVERYSNALNQAVSIAIKNAAAAVAIGLATNMMDVGIMALTLGFGSYLILNYPDELSIGELITFQLYANMMNNSYKGINNSLNELTKSAGAAERVLALMDVPPTPENEEISNYHTLARNGKKFGSSICFRIRFDDVHFRYPNRPINKVLKGLSFVCQPGKVTALVGPSGSGKSTVVQLLQRFYGCNGGAVRIGILERGQGSPLPTTTQETDELTMGRQESSSGNYELVEEIPLNEIARADWLSDVAVVAQDTQLFSTTVFENITYGISNTRAYEGVAEHQVDTSNKANRKLLMAANAATQWQRRNNSAASSTPAVPMTEPDLYSDTEGEGKKRGGNKHATVDVLSPTTPSSDTVVKSVVSFEDVVVAAKKAQAHDFIMKLPEGYHTPIGERGCTLSGGQRQRLAIARALLRKPKLLLLDEATSALDNESEALVQKAIDDLLATERQSDRCTVLVIAHRLTTIKNADNIVVLQDGLVSEEGTHSTLSHAGGLYQSFLSSGFPKSEAPATAEGATKDGGGRKKGK